MKPKRRPSWLLTTRRGNALLVLLAFVTILLIAAIWSARDVYPASTSATPCYQPSPMSSARERVAGVWGCLEAAE